MITGKVGLDLSLDEAREAARRPAENLLAVPSIAVAGDGIEAILLARYQVNAANDFSLVQVVIDAPSELIIEPLGTKGRHARDRDRPLDAAQQQCRDAARVRV